MSKKVISILLSAAMLVAMLCVGFGAVTASAADGMTYYFLAPDNWFKTEAGAYNDQVGAYWWQGDNTPGDWPGKMIEAAPEVGANVFKIEGVAANVSTIIFNAGFDAKDDEELLKMAHQTVNINTEGYDNDCPYDKSVATDDFNGWIYVLDNNAKTEGTDVSKATVTGGAWFTLDNYKSNEQYYGSYGFAAENTTSEAPVDSTVESKTEETTSKTETTGAKYHVGDKVTVDIQMGKITMRNGDEAKLAAYNYALSYNKDALKVVPWVDPEDPDTTSPAEVVIGTDSFTANDETAGQLLFGDMAAKGMKGNVSEMTTVLTVNFEVTADTDDLGIKGECTSLTAASKDGKTTDKLVGELGPKETEAGLTAADMQDKYTALNQTVDCPHATTSSEPESSAPVTSSEAPVSSTAPVSSVAPATSSVAPATSSVAPATSSKTTSSKKATSSTTSKKETGDNASSKATSSTKGTTSTTTTTGTSTATVATAGTFAVVSLVVILMAAAAVVLYTRKKTEE